MEQMGRSVLIGQRTSARRTSTSQANDVSVRIDRKHACEERSISSDKQSLSLRCYMFSLLDATPESARVLATASHSTLTIRNTHEKDRIGLLVALKDTRI